MREDEILNVARFKLGATARRLVILAESASDPKVRDTLLELSAILLSEQCGLDPRSQTLRCEDGRRSGAGEELERVAQPT
jgi:hypothetical protein